MAADRQRPGRERQAPPAPWHGLSVRASDGAHLGIVVGSFEEGPCAGRLRVHGDAAQFPRRGMSGTAVFAIRRDAVARHQNEALILHAPASTARYRWFVHTIG